MKITPELVDKLALLSRLEFDEAGKEEIRADLEKMIGFVDKLNELDTTGVVPLTHVSGENPDTREDKAGAMLSNEEALGNASETRNGYFTVPAAVKKTDS